MIAPRYLGSAVMLVGFGTAGVLQAITAPEPGLPTWISATVGGGVVVLAYVVGHSDAAIGAAKRQKAAHAARREYVHVLYAQYRVLRRHELTDEVQDAYDQIDPDEFDPKAEP